MGCRARGMLLEMLCVHMHMHVLLLQLEAWALGWQPAARAVGCALPRQWPGTPGDFVANGAVVFR